MRECIHWKAAGSLSNIIWKYIQANRVFWTEIPGTNNSDLLSMHHHFTYGMWLFFISMSCVLAINCFYLTTFFSFFLLFTTSFLFSHFYFKHKVIFAFFQEGSLCWYKTVYIQPVYVAQQLLCPHFMTWQLAGNITFGSVSLNCGKYGMMASAFVGKIEKINSVGGK